MDIEGRILSPKVVRTEATRMGIPAEMPLPEVIVVGKEAAKELQTGPQLHQDAAEGQSLSGYFATIPERMVSREPGGRIYFPTNIREDIRHELAHYLENVELGRWGEELGPREEVAKEIRAELRSGPRSLPHTLAQVAWNLKGDYSLEVSEAFRLMEEAARNLGVNKWVISRARKRYYEAVSKGSFTGSRIDRR